MMDPLSVLRDFAARGELDKIVQVGEEFRFGEAGGEYAFPCSALTAYRSKLGGHYTLDALLFFLRHHQLKHTDYLQSARLHRLHTVTLPDRRPLLDYLLGPSPPECTLLLIGCLLGLATGSCVAAFNRGVYAIHEWAWAGTPNEGAAWLRLQRLADTWHRILQIPVTGGVVVGMMHGLLEIFEQIKQSRSTRRDGIDFLAGIFQRFNCTN